MTREYSIPLFLWIATALVVHAIGGGGATEVSRVLQEKMDIASFAKAVGKKARLEGQPVEVSFDVEEPPVDEIEVEEPEVEPDAPPDLKVPDPEDAPAQPKPDEKKKKPEDEKKKDEPKPEEKKVPTPLEKPPEKPPSAQGRIAVQQHVQNPNQEDNPNARFAADQANHVEEETQARITSTDQNDPHPTPGGNFAGSHKEPGNSDEHKVAQSEESPGEKGHAPGSEDAKPTSDPAQAAATAARTPPTATPTPPPPAGAAQRPTPTPPTSSAAQEAQAARAAQAEKSAVPESHTSPNGAFSVPRPQAAQAAQTARKKLPPRKSTRVTDMFGLGQPGLTANGVSLNLTPQMAMTVVGADRLAMERKGVGERRLAQHRGSWQSLGLERWRSAIENYVPVVKPGNTTALNAARVPFAGYINAIHNRVHPVFAEHFLSSLGGLPASHPLNNLEMSTFLEIQLSGQDGRVMRMGVTKTSGVTGFDVGALDSVQRAGPYGTPPPSILSSDGNVYLHWEFHRLPERACSTYFAYPKIVKIGQESAPPSVIPPAPVEGEKSGELDEHHHEHGAPHEHHDHEHHEHKTGELQEPTAEPTSPSARGGKSAESRKSKSADVPAP